MNENTLSLALACSLGIHLALVMNFSGLAGQGVAGSEARNNLAVVIGGASASVKHLSVATSRQSDVQGKTGLRRADDSVPIAGYSIGDPYVPASLLDNLPEVIDDIPDHSSALDSFTDAGAVVLVLHVNERGLVDAIELESSDVPDFVAEEIRESFFMMRFRPGTINGRATRFGLRIEASIRPLVDGENNGTN